jgi:small conductance mechanosensitive channel
MHTRVLSFKEMMQQILANIMQALPSLILAIFVLIVGILFIRKMKDLSFQFINKRTKDTLVSDFIVNLISLILILILVVTCLSIIGWGEITDKILAGAGITTFVIGFALKDIGENFLAGILMAFKRPFRVGDLVEINGNRGKVMSLSMRQTTLKTLDGKDVYIPNSILIKNPLINFTIHDLLRAEFTVAIAVDKNIEEAIAAIKEVLTANPLVLKEPKFTVVVENLDAANASLLVQYWFTTEDVSAPGLNLKSSILLAVKAALAKKNLAFS